jgi:cell division protein FtsA
VALPDKKRKRGRVIVGLDVGTTKICAIAGEVSEEGITVLAMGSHPSTGLRKGVVIDIEATANSIKKAVSGVREQLGIPVNEVYVGIAGSHIKSIGSYGAVGIKGKDVTPEDVDRAIDSAGAVYVPLDREILHVLPTDFILDGQGGIKDPVGMAGVRLEVQVHIVTGAVASVQNLIKCCERADLKVLDIVLQPLASSEATLTADERDMGVALVDIGGGTTDIAVYKDGWLRHTSVLGIGGNHFTNDVSVGLRLPFNEAERVKKKYGTVLQSDLNDGTDMDVVGIDGQVRGIPRKYLGEIIRPRCDELLELIRQEINVSPGYDVGVSEVVLTGGASLLSGLDRMAEAVFSLPVRIGYLHRVEGIRGELNHPMYATAIGLLLYEAASMMPDERNGFSSDLFAKIVDKMTGWFRRIVGNG